MRIALAFCFSSSSFVEKSFGEDVLCDKDDGAEESAAYTEKV